MGDRFQKTTDAPRLNRQRPFGAIQPPFFGAVIMQGHHYYGPQDVYLFTDTEATATKPAPAPHIEESPTLPPATETFGGKTLPVEPPVTDDSPSATDSADGIDLVAWARGEENYNFMKVKAKAGDLFPDAQLTDSKSITDAMIDAGMITDDEVKK